MRNERDTLQNENIQLRKLITDNNIKTPGLNNENEGLNELYFQRGQEVASVKTIDKCNLSPGLRRKVYIQIGKDSNEELHNLSGNNLSQQHNTETLKEQEAELTKQAILKSLKDLTLEEQDIQNALLASILPQKGDILQQKRIIKPLGET